MSEPVEVLAQNRRTDGRREWSSVGAWLQPGQSLTATLRLTLQPPVTTEPSA
jgi:hypothetical protein